VVTPAGKRDQKTEGEKRDLEIQRAKIKRDPKKDMDGNEGRTYVDMDAAGKAPPVSAQVCLHLLFIHLVFYYSCAC
jgi:hypothetical protein